MCLDQLIAQKFDPYFGLWAGEDIQDSAYDTVVGLSDAAIRAYEKNDVDIYEIAANGEPNPLTPDDVNKYVVADIPTSSEDLLRAYFDHSPYQVFLRAVELKMGTEIILAPGVEPYMQFEPVYLEALMITHPDALEAAMMVYKGDYVARGQEATIIKIIENLDTLLESAFGQK